MPASPSQAPAQAPALPVPVLPLDSSVGYQVRLTHRLIQRALQARISQHGVTLGMWYFLRVLWEEDGITQRELSNRIGTMEPTTLSAMVAMEREGIVRRVRNAEDRRKVNIYLTDHGRALQAMLLPSGVAVVADALRGLSARQVATLLTLLGAVQRNVQATLDAVPASAPPAPTTMED